MLLSIVIPTCGKRETLHRAITSAIKQKDADTEIIVVDDRREATTNLLEGLEVGSNVTVVRNNRKHGVAAARNAGIQSAVGEWILFLDDDDEFNSNFFRAVRNHLNLYPHLDFFWSGINSVNTDINGCIQQKEVCYFEKKDALYIGAGFGVGIRRKFLEERGAFDESFDVGEDTELFVRMLANGALAQPLQSIGVIRYETQKERLTNGYERYSYAKIYERIFDKYKSYFKSNEVGHVHLITWSTLVHLKNKNYKFCFSCVNRLLYLWKVFNVIHLLIFISLKFFKLPSAKKFTFYDIDFTENSNQ